MEEAHKAPSGRSTVSHERGGYRHERLYAAEPVRRSLRRQPYGRRLLMLGLLVALVPGLMMGRPEGQHLQTAAQGGEPREPDTLSVQVEVIPPAFVPVAVRVPEWIRLDPPDAPRAGTEDHRASAAPLLWTGATLNGSGATAVMPAAPAEVALGSTPARSDFLSQPLTVSEVIRVIGVGVASYYGRALAGNPTASGEPFDPTELTAAHRSLPFGTRLRVTNLSNDQSVVVRVNDRGPFIPGRIIDLSRSAALAIDMIRRGTAHVRLEVLEQEGRR